MTASRVVAYHVTAESRLPAILAEGLKPRGEGGASAMFVTAAVPGVVYLWREFGDAHSYAVTTAYQPALLPRAREELERPVIVRASLRLERLTPDHENLSSAANFVLETGLGVGLLHRLAGWSPTAQEVLNRGEYIDHDEVVAVVQELPVKARPRLALEITGSRR